MVNYYPLVDLRSTFIIPTSRKAMEMRETALHQPAPCEALEILQKPMDAWGSIFWEDELSFTSYFLGLPEFWPMAISLFERAKQLISRESMKTPRSSRGPFEWTTTSKITCHDVFWRDRVVWTCGIANIYRMYRCTQKVSFWGYQTSPGSNHGVFLHILQVVPRMAYRKTSWYI